MWRVVVDIAPKTIMGTNKCHKYVFGKYKTKRTAAFQAEAINELGKLGKAYIEKIK